MKVIKRCKSLLIFGAVLFALATTFVVRQAVYAATYGSGPYGTCGYQTNCEPSTIVTLPPSKKKSATSLQVDINLKNGQVIPRSGYTVIVTPLNGKGTSFKQVSFYINGVLVQTQKPAEDGTATWFWNVAQHPGTIVKVVVTGTDGQTVSKTFDVTLGALPRASTAQKAVAPTAQPSILQHIAQGITHRVAKLPKQVKYGLPYFLFILLIGDILLLFLRARHEITESERLKMLLMRERQNAELKHSFMSLVSHYLRTPVTIINSSLDLASRPGLVSPTINAIRDCTERLKATIESLLEHVSTQTAVVTSQSESHIAAAPIWRQTGLYVPLVLIGILVFPFDYFAHHGGSFSLGQVNLITQLVLFITLSVLLYQMFRYRQLRRREMTERQRVLQEEVAFNNQRDQVIAESSTEVKRIVDELTPLAVQLQMPQVQKLVQNGVTRLQDVVAKLQAASLLRGSHSVDPYVSVELGDVVQRALLGGLDDKVKQKSLDVKILQSVSFQVQNKELLIVVLQTVLDNAIAYSAQDGSIEVNAAVDRDNVTIAITDHGPGIPADKQYSLFQAFSKTEGAETFSHEGMGFSLYLDKLIMNYLVGDITVEAAPQQGTKVQLVLRQPISGPEIVASTSIAAQPS